MKKTKAFLFDFDGTLVDTMEGFADIAGEVINRFHPEMSFKEARRKYIETSGIPFCQQIELIYPAHKDNSEIVKIFERTKISGFFKQTFSKDVRTAIETLRKRGYLAGVSSGNFPDLINEFVKKEALEFDVVMGFDKENNFEKGKPHFDYFLNKFKLSKNDLTFVGDSLKDSDKAFDNSINFIGVTGLFTKEEFEKHRPGIKTIKNLIELLEMI